MNTTPKATLNPGKPPITRTETVVMVLEKGAAPTVTITMSLRDAAVIRAMLGATSVDDGYNAFRSLKAALDPEFPARALMSTGYSVAIPAPLLAKVNKAVDDYLSIRNLQETN